MQGRDGAQAQEAEESGIGGREHEGEKGMKKKMWRKKGENIPNYIEKHPVTDQLGMNH